MNGTGIPWLGLFVAALSGLAMLAMLRVLACVRAHVIEAHESLCEIRRLRNEYFARKNERGPGA